VSLEYKNAADKVVEIKAFRRKAILPAHLFRVIKIRVMMNE
jgi:hypothetical protein